MTDKKKPSAPKSAQESARRIWLAGIGAYGRAFTEAQEALKDVTGKSSEVFDDLVQKGAMLEKVGKAKGKEALDKAQMPNFDIPDFDIDERIKAMRSRLSRGDKGGVEMASYDDRLTAVEAKLDRILELLEPKKPVSKKPVKRKTTTSTQRTTTKKTTAKKAPPKKTATKTTSAKKPAPKKSTSKK